METKLKRKVTIIGAMKCGKTSLINRIINGDFNEKYIETIGIDFLAKSYEKCRVQFWDCAGNKKVDSLIPNYIRDSKIILIMFDLTDRVSFDEIIRFRNHIENDGLLKKAKLILVGNKSDLDKERKVSYEEGMSKANEVQAAYIEISVKNRTNIKELTDILTGDIY